METEPLLQSQSRVEVRLHGEQVNDDQNRQDGPKRKRHPFGADRVRGQQFHAHKVGDPPVPRMAPAPIVNAVVSFPQRRETWAQFALCAGVDP